MNSTSVVSDDGESLGSWKRTFSQHGVQIPPSLWDVQHSRETVKLLWRQQGLLSVGVQKRGEKEKDGWVTFWGALMKTCVKRPQGEKNEITWSGQSQPSKKWFISVGVEVIFGHVHHQHHQHTSWKCGECRNVGFKTSRGFCCWRSEGLIGVQLHWRRNGSSEVKTLFPGKPRKSQKHNNFIPEYLGKTRALFIIPLS